MSRPFFLIFIACLMASCTGRQAKSPAIRDFRSSLRPALISAVGTAIVSSDTGTRYIYDHGTDEELILLSRCEHPILRAIALTEMTRRPAFDHMKVMMEHLDDTALVLVDHGEFGTYFRMVSDVMIERGKWKTKEARLQLIDEIIRHHNTLRSAFTGLVHVDTAEKYYTYIKEMVVRDRRIIDDMVLAFDEKEFALYALARCKRPEDIPLIKGILLENTSRMTEISFGLIRDFPDSAYMEVMKKFYWYFFYKRICRDRSTYLAEAFLPALGAFRNDISAGMLQNILDRRPFMPCTTDTLTLKDAVMKAIWNNPCPAYAGLRKRIEWYFHKPPDKADRVGSMDNIDTTNYLRKDDPEPVWWY